MKPRLLLTVIAAAALVIAGAAVIVLTINQPPRAPLNGSYDTYSTASDEPHCPNLVTMYFTTDEAMREAVSQLQNDSRFYNTVRETKAQNYERFKRIFKDQPEVVSLTKPETLPASVTFAVALAAGRRDLLVELRSTYAPVDIQDPCDVTPTTTTRPTR